MFYCRLISFVIELRASLSEVLPFQLLQAGELCLDALVDSFAHLGQVGRQILQSRSHEWVLDSFCSLAELHTL
jgi:hypothetical protein